MMDRYQYEDHPRGHPAARSASFVVLFAFAAVLAWIGLAPPEA
jgi:hypothetical protein